MSNDLYNVTGTPASRSPGASPPMRAEFVALQQAFDKFAAFAGNAGKALIRKEIDKMPDSQRKVELIDRLRRIEETDERDLYF